MYSPAEQRNTPLIAGNVKSKIVCFLVMVVGRKYNYFGSIFNRGLEKY